MASITIRNLNQNTKDELRLSAATFGHSMEEEARLRLSQPREQNLTSSSISTLRPVLSLSKKKILLIIGGGIAAYKALEFIRRLKERGALVRVVMTKAAQSFITTLSATVLSGSSVYTNLFSEKTESELGHIKLANWADLIVYAPLTATRMAKIVSGVGDDLAGAVLLAYNGPTLLAPAMNPKMWSNPATQRNYTQLNKDGYHFIGPDVGEMAESNAYGLGRMSDPMQLVSATEFLLKKELLPLKGKKIVVTAGPTQEFLDPIRYISNLSSGKQGYAIAEALTQLGAETILISGPVKISHAPLVQIFNVTCAQEMYDAIERQLPCDCLVMAAAVSDWRALKMASRKIKKDGRSKLSSIRLTENIDILSTIGNSPKKPPLLIGFAAETHDVFAYAFEKFIKKGVDWIVANDVSIQRDGSCVMGGNQNKITLIKKNSSECWPLLDKRAVAIRLAEEICNTLLSC